MARAGGVRDVEGNANSIEIVSLARFAVDEHNKKEETEMMVGGYDDAIIQNSVLEFKKVVSAKQQVVSGTLYYITIEVKDGDGTKVYEAKVWEKPWLNFKEVKEFKVVGDSPSESST